MCVYMMSMSTYQTGPIEGDERLRFMCDDMIYDPPSNLRLSSPPLSINQSSSESPRPGPALTFATDPHRFTISTTDAGRGVM